MRKNGFMSLVRLVLITVLAGGSACLVFIDHSECSAQGSTGSQLANFQQNRGYLPVGNMSNAAVGQPKQLHNTRIQNPSGQKIDTKAPAAINGNGTQSIVNGRLRLPYCKVKLIKKIEIPALESGALTQFHVLQGDAVPANMLLAMVDNQGAKTELDAAKARLVAAQTKIDNDIAVKAAEAAFNKADKAYNRDVRLSRRNGISREELEESQLEQIHSKLQIDKAKEDRRVEKKKVEVEKFNVQKATEIYHRHKVLSPWPGTIGKIHKHQGEWVNAGDTILELLQMERLWVEANVMSNLANPHELIDRPVTISIKQARGEIQQIAGQVIFVDVEKDGAGYLTVRAEVPNKKMVGHWLLLPGGNVQMEIHINEPARTSMRRRDFRRN